MPNTIEQNTKKAWNENWKPHEIESLLEIFNYPRVKKQLDLYFKYLPKDGYILEGGCGLGPYLIHLSSLGYKIIGVDYNEDPLKKILNYNNKLPVSVMDVRRLAVADKSLSGYMSLGVIEHFPEGPKKAIEEAFRTLKQGGIFVVQVPILNIFMLSKYPFEVIKRNILLRKIFHKQEKVYYWQQYFKPKQLKRTIEKSGFEVEKIIPMDHEHSIISFSAYFRDKNSYDGANERGLKFSRFCEKYLPWLTAANMVLICRKTS